MRRGYSLSQAAGNIGLLPLMQLDGGSGRGGDAGGRDNGGGGDDEYAAAEIVIVSIRLKAHEGPAHVHGTERLM